MHIIIIFIHIYMHRQGWRKQFYNTQAARPVADEGHDFGGI